MTTGDVLRGFFPWAPFREPIGAPVSSYFLEPAGVVVDPKVPEDGLDALPGEPRQVVLTTGLHHRDAPRFAEAFGIPVRASVPARDRLGDALAVETHHDGEEGGPRGTAP